MYENWVAERWQTPFSDVQSLVMVSLIDDGSPRLVLEDARGEERCRWSVRFENVVAYRNMLEEYRVSLWARREEIGGPRGWTWRLTRSDWLCELREQEPLVDINAPGAIHYLIATEDDVVEVFMAELPVIDELGPAADAARPGKSTVLYRGEDDDRIEAEFARLRRRKPNLMDTIRKILGRKRAR